MDGPMTNARSGVPTSEQRPQTWTFSSSGWLFVYYFGVIKALRESGNDRDMYVIGSSGGACAGGLLFLPEVDIDGMVSFILDCAVDARKSWFNRLKVRQYVQAAVENFCPDDVAQRVAGNMEISVTRLLGFHNIRWSQFKDKAEYVDAILASSCVVGLAGLPYWTRKYGYLIDGAYSDFQLAKSFVVGTKFCTFHNGNVTSVCPFYCSRADIKPSRFVPLHWALTPPSPEDLFSVYLLAVHDTLDHLQGKRRVGPSTAAAIYQRCRQSRDSMLPHAPPPSLLSAPSLSHLDATAPPRVEREAEGAWCQCKAAPAHGESGREQAASGSGTPRGGGAHDCGAGARWIGRADAGQGAAPAQPCRDSESLFEEDWQTLLQDGLQEARRQARHSAEDLEAMLRGLSALARSAVRSWAWSMVYVELLLQTQLCTAIAWLAVLLPVPELRKAWSRARFCWQSVFNHRLWLKMTPVLGSGVRMAGNTPFEQELEQVSFMYRLLYYLL